MNYKYFKQYHILYFKPFYIDFVIKNQNIETNELKDDKIYQKLHENYLLAEQAKSKEQIEIDQTYQDEIDEELYLNDDIYYDHFYQILSANNQQCIRYNYHGNTLLSSIKHLNYQSKLCSNCGATRILEMQLMPYLLSLLKIDNFNDSIHLQTLLQYTTIDIYTCSKNCINICHKEQEIKDPDTLYDILDLEYVEEEIYIQSIIETNHKKKPMINKYLLICLL